jgi:hypothetical protein
VSARSGHQRDLPRTLIGVVLVLLAALAAWKLAQ